MLTDEQAKAYIAAHGVHCPYCESENITGGPVEVDAGSAWQETTCDSCNASWRDIYELVEVESDTPPSEQEPDEPHEGDWVTCDHIRFFEHSGRGVIVVPTVDGDPGDWKAAVKARMKADRFWSNVWSLSDHGNYCLLSLED